MFSFTYKVGLPFWKFFVKHGATAKIYVEVIWDEEAKVLVAQSSNLKGLVTSAPTLQELHSNIIEAADILFEDCLHTPPHTKSKLKPLLNFGEDLCGA